MADAKIVLRADSREVKQATRNLDQMRSSLGGLGTAARLAAGALVGIGITKFARSVIKTGIEVENLQTRFKFLFGSAKEGAKAFDTLSKFAGTVPFSLEEIAAASGNLAVVSENAEELKKNLELTANVAAVSGLDFQTAGEQIQRALSGGISAADLLRERGIKALLGFKDGVKVTTAETEKALTEAFGPGGRFDGAAIALANNFTGIASMIGDKFFNIKRIISDSGPFDFLKGAAKALDDALTKNFKSIEAAAKGFGQEVVNQFKLFLIGTAELLTAFDPVIQFIITSFNNVVNLTKNAPGYIKALGVIGFLALGTRGKIIVTIIAGVYEQITNIVAGFINLMGSISQKIAPVLDALGMDEQAEALKKNGASLKKEAQAIKDSFKNLGKEAKTSQEKIDDFNEKLDSGKASKYESAIGGLLDTIQAGQDKIENTRKEIDKANEAMKKQREESSRATNAFRDYKEALGEVFEEAAKNFDPVKEAVDLTTDLFSSLKKGIGDAFADAILGAKTLSEALNNLAQQILKQLISGLIQLGLEIFVFDVLREKIKSARREAQALNRTLQSQAMGQALGSLFGPVGSVVGSIFGGFFADGGRLGAGKVGIAGEAGPELISGPAQVTPLEDLSAGAGEMNITFNINTIDATGFNELLTTRQDLIVGLVNRALAERGKRSLTA